MGDPLTTPDLIPIIKYFKECNQNTVIKIHTNGSLRSREMWTTLAYALGDNDTVVFSIDGLEDTNHIYRRGTNWQKIMNNSKAFISAGGNAIWEFLKFKHNEHQIDEAKNRASARGFTEFVVKSPVGFINGRMIVMGKDGQLENILYPSGFVSASGEIAVQKKENVIRYKETVFDVASKSLEDLEQLGIDQTVQIDCIAKRDKEIYIDAHGGIHPCCFLGQVSDSSSGPITAQYWHWINNNVGFDNINAIDISIYDILDSEYFSLIEQTWDKYTFANGKLARCVTSCPKNFVMADKIYNK